MSCPCVATVRPPTYNSVVHKNECTQCFDSEDSEGGLNVCLHCFNGGCTGASNHSLFHANKTGHGLVLNIRRTEVQSSEPPQKITKVAIGVPGGGGAPEKLYQHTTTVKCLICGLDDIPVTGPLEAVVNGVMSARSASDEEKLASWEFEKKPCTHTENLVQPPNAPQLAAKGLAHCESCDLTSNLWLCLECGKLGCGRAYFDGTGGNGHALEHSKAANHGVAVKLGTITAEGNADIHCYTCDEEVIDPKLAAHLAHFGINIASQEKTEKSISELELEQNLNLNLSKVFEKDSTPMFGAGLTGLHNLGNSCYMASVLQVVMSIPALQERYFHGAEDHALTCTAKHDECFHCQMMKLATGLLSGKYSQEKIETSEDGTTHKVQDGISPRMFKSLIGADHAEFKGVRQQDAMEFFQYFLETLKKKEHAHGVDPSAPFKFKLQERIQCQACNRVRYNTANSTDVAFPIAATEGSCSFQACAERYGGEEIIEGFNCPQCNSKTNAAKTSRLETMPNILVVNMRRFLFENWVPTKSAVSVTMSQVTDLSPLRGLGQQPGEELLPEEAAPEPMRIEANQEALNNLMGMGFPQVRCEKALFATGNNSADVAAQWLFEHMDDPDIDVPAEAPLAAGAGAGGGGGGNDAPSEMVAMLESMGFTSKQAKKALRETSNDVERAVEWLFSHPDDQGDDDTAAAPASAAADHPMTDGHARYELFGFITHLGTSTQCGHYVAHVKKGDQWVLFNDNKVASVPEAPIGGAYVYFFKRAGSAV